MCDPLSLTIAATAMATIGTGISAYQGYTQNKYQQKVAERNVKLENEAARDSIDRGKIEAQQHWRKVAQIKGAQQVALAANGLDTSFGSAGLLAEDTAMFANEDADALYKNQAQRTRGFEINASNFGGEANARGQAATGSLIKGAFDMGSTALSGATQYSKLKAKMN
jgi:hypothetical protein